MRKLRGERGGIGADRSGSPNKGKRGRRPVIQAWKTSRIKKKPLPGPKDRVKESRAGEEPECWNLFGTGGSSSPEKRETRGKVRRSFGTGHSGNTGEVKYVGRSQVLRGRKATCHDSKVELPTYSKFRRRRTRLNLEEKG